MFDIVKIKLFNRAIIAKDLSINRTKDDGLCPFSFYALVKETIRERKKWLK